MSRRSEWNRGWAEAAGSATPVEQAERRLQEARDANRVEDVNFWLGWLAAYQSERAVRP